WGGGTRGFGGVPRKLFLGAGAAQAEGLGGLDAAGAVAEDRGGLAEGAEPLGQVLVGVAGVERQRLGLRRHRLDRAVAEHARPRRDQLADDHVLLEAEQLVGAAL